MIYDAVISFKHIYDILPGIGSPCQLLCSQNKIITHRKLKARWKNIRNLEYTDPETNATAKFSDEDFEEINAIQSFKVAMHNETGPKKTHPVDITQFSRNYFTRYLDDYYDPENPDKYDINLACMSINFYNNMGGSILDYQDRAPAHVLNVLLDAAVNNETTLALEENGVTSLPIGQPIYVHRG